jgi:cytochrome P450
MFRYILQIDDLYGNDSRMPSLDDIVRLPYVEATILETMRKETVAPGAIPHRILEDTEFHGYFLPKGTIVGGQELNKSQ